MEWELSEFAEEVWLFLRRKWVYVCKYMSLWVSMGVYMCLCTCVIAVVRDCAGKRLWLSVAMNVYSNLHVCVRDSACVSVRLTYVHTRLVIYVYRKMYARLRPKLFGKYVCSYIYIYFCMPQQMCASAHAFVYIFLNIYFACFYVHASLCMSICSGVRVWIYAYTCLNNEATVYVLMHVSLYGIMHICLYI